MHLKLPSKNSYSKWSVRIFTLSFIVNLLAIAYRGNFTNVQTWENGWIASNILSGYGFASTYLTGSLEPSSVMAPIYPYFLAAIYSLVGQGSEAFVIIQIIQAAVQAGTVVLVYYLAYSLFSKSVGAVAGITYAMYPVSVYGVTVIHQMTFATFIVTALAVVALHTGRRETLQSATLLGVTLGSAALIFPTVLVTAPLIAFWLVFRGGVEQPVKRISLVVLVAIVSFLVISPWTIRNYLVHDQFVLVKFTGWNLFRGNYPPAIYTGIPNQLADAPNTIVNRVQGGMSKAEANDYLGRLAFEYILAHPGAFILKFFKNIFYLWWFPPVSERVAGQVPFIRKVVYTPVLISTIHGLIQSWGERDMGLIYAFFLAFSIGYGIFFVLPRYRVHTILPFMFVFVGVTGASLLRRWQFDI